MSIMRNAKFKSVEPNYRRNLLQITLLEGRKSRRYSLPFSLVGATKASARNRFAHIEIERELGDQGVSYVLEDGTRGDFPSDLVLYHCDPTYDWAPVNQLKRALKSELGKSRLSVRVLADALRTSPTQVVRLLEENRASKQLLQLFKLAELAGYRIEFRLRKKSAA
jgi:hypothetical protein